MNAMRQAESGGEVVMEWREKSMGRIPDYVIKMQECAEKRWAEEKEKLGGSYLVALYNLHLPEVPFSPEDKKRLSDVVSHFIEPPAVSLEAPPTFGNRRSAGLILPTSSGYFEVTLGMMGYSAYDDEKGIYHPGDAWWNSEDFFIAFQRNYQHLRGCIESCIEGEGYFDFRRADLEWFDEKMKLIRQTITLAMKNPIPGVAGNNPGTVRPVEENSQIPSHSIVCYIAGPARPGETHFQVRGPLTPLRQFTPFQDEHPSDDRISLERYFPVMTSTMEHDLPPSDLILHQAYLELRDLIQGNKEFRHCSAQDCHQIFLPNKQRRKYHSGECAQEAKKAQDNKSKETERDYTYKEMAGWLAQLPQGEELDATDITETINEINRIAGRSGGLTGHKVGGRLRIKEQKATLERLHGITYEPRPTGRQSFYTFRKMQL